MKVSVEPEENQRVRLRVEVEAERVERAIDGAYRRLVKKVHVPGFRPGKAPRFLLERHLGKGELGRRALDDLLPEVYREALHQADLEPVDRPEVTVKKFQEGEPLLVEISMWPRPQAEIGDLSDLRVEAETPEVTPQEVEQAVERLRRQYASLATVEGEGAKPGDYVVLDWELRRDGELLEAVRDRMLELFDPRQGRPGDAAPVGLPDEVISELVGAREGERREKDGYVITVRAVKRPELPELNDDFARQVGKFSSLEELKRAIENSLLREAANRIREKQEAQISDELLRRCRVEAPEPLVEEELGRIVDEYKAGSGRTLTSEEEEELRAELRPVADGRVRVDLILETIARREGLLPTEEEMEGLTRQFLREGETVAQARARLEESGIWRALRRGVARSKAMRALRERATRGENDGVPGAGSDRADG